MMKKDTIHMSIYESTKGENINENFKMQRRKTLKKRIER